MVPTQLPILSFPSKAAFETWLAGNHRSAPGLWLKIARKGAHGRPVGRGVRGGEGGHGA